MFVIGWRKEILWTRDGEGITTRDDEGLIKSERCYWITTSLYRKYNTFSDRESEQEHRTMTFVELPNRVN